MKKISKKDLSLQRETVSYLSDENSSEGDWTKKEGCPGVTNHTHCGCADTKNGNTCAQTCTTCPDTNGKGCGGDTFESICMCVTIQCNDTTPENMCDVTESQGPICCAPDPPVNLSKDNPEACLLTAEFCETKNICPNTNGEICKTKHCEAISVELRCLTKPCP